MVDTGAISQAVEIRHFFASDFDNGFVETLAALSPICLSQQEVGNILRTRLRSNIQTVVAVSDNKIVGTASYFLEKKFLHNGGVVMHVEDVAVHKDYQGQGIGKAIMGFLQKEATRSNCYKVILDCNEQNVNFYEKCKYRRHEVGMRMDLPP